ncbi:xylulokinase [Anaerotalea alkaliphila]|uniref:Sugar kinase n=1 Tax=Anaerotalea alkaliphila TaxID=2662126 RepID=A0A7X5KN98_9FIRM|nr:FGGY family carbohydrate kinase [Anaerotalea alkaliphila]NDL67563.1 sugar kinase [Anaerotalea alkaliphila]
MEAYLLGIDIGTGSVKTTVIDAQANVLGMAIKEYPILRERTGWASMDTKTMWEATVHCLKELVVKQGIEPGNIRSIGLSCLCPGLTAFGENNEVLMDPIIYSDRRSIRQAERIQRSVDLDAVFEKTANNVMSGAISVTSMLWIKEEHPYIYEKTRYFGHVNTLMGMLLTGQYGIDHTNASYTALFETVGSKQWSKELCDLFGIDMEKLPPVLLSTDTVGHLDNKEFIGLGLPEGIPVIIGGADTPCASITCGVTRHGDACESAGTSNVITICTDKPRFSKGFINRCHVVEGTWVYQGAMSNTGASLRWARDELCKDLTEAASRSGKNAFELINEEVEASAPGSNGIVFLPYMAGERCPIWDPYARGVFFGVSLDSKRGDLLRSIMEGCGYGLRQLIGIAEDLTGTEYQSFVSVGGGANSIIWSQIKADITGKKVLVLDIKEAASIGAALLAGVGCGIFGSIQEAADKVKRNVTHVILPNGATESVYEKGYRTYLELYPRIKDLYQNYQNC